MLSELFVGDDKINDEGALNKSTVTFKTKDSIVNTIKAAFF